MQQRLFDVNYGRHDDEVRRNVRNQRIREVPFTYEQKTKSKRWNSLILKFPTLIQSLYLHPNINVSKTSITYILAIKPFPENATADRCICGSTPANDIRRPRTLFADVIVFTFLFFIYRSHVSVYLNICFLRLHTTFTCYLHQFIPVTRYIPVICYLCQHHRTVI